MSCPGAEDEDQIIVQSLRAMDATYGTGEWEPLLRRLGLLSSVSFYSAFESVSPELNANVKTADLAPILVSLREKSSEWAEEADAACLKSRTYAPDPARARAHRQAGGQRGVPSDRALARQGLGAADACRLVAGRCHAASTKAREGNIEPDVVFHSASSHVRVFSESHRLAARSLSST